MRMFAVRMQYLNRLNILQNLQLNAIKQHLTRITNTVCKLSLCKYLLKRPIKSIVPYTKSIVVPYKPKKISVANNIPTGKHC